MPEKLGQRDFLTDIARIQTMMQAKLDALSFVQPTFLTTPLSSTSWDGDAKSTTAKTLLDLSAVFGAPAGIKAALVYSQIRDSASAGNFYYLILSPSGTAGVGPHVNIAYSGKNDQWSYYTCEVPCTAGGDIYYQIAASGSGTMDVYIYIWGYWLEQ